MRRAVHLLLYRPLLDLIQLHVEARPELLQLDVFSRAFATKRVGTRAAGQAGAEERTHRYKWWRNCTLSLRLAKVIMRLLSALGTGKMCFSMVAVRWPRLLRLETKRINRIKEKGL